jgi:hypothetical protein
MQSESRLVNVLLAKSIAESALIGAIAVLFFMNVFPPFLRGWGEATPLSIAGWVVKNDSPWERVEVQLFIDNVFVAATFAQQSRPDVVAAGWAEDEWHGFEFEVPNINVGNHEARVYALHASGGGIRRSLQLIGDPILFRKNQDGTLTDLRTEAVHSF